MIISMHRLVLNALTHYPHRIAMDSPYEGNDADSTVPRAMCLDAQLQLQQQQQQQQQQKQQMYLEVMAATPTQPGTGMNIIPPSPLPNNNYSYASQMPGDNPPQLGSQLVHSIPQPFSAMSQQQTFNHNLFSPTGQYIYENYSNSTASQLLHPQQQRFNSSGSVSYFSMDGVLQYRSPSPVASIATSSSPHPSDDGSLAGGNMSLGFNNLIGLPMYEVEPVSPMSAVRAMSGMQGLNIGMPANPPPALPSQPLPQQSLQLSREAIYSQPAPAYASHSSTPNSLQADARLSRQSSTESVAAPNNTRRAHSDVTDLSSAPARRAQDDNSVQLVHSVEPRPSADDLRPLSLPLKRVAGRHSIPNRDRKRECNICHRRFKKLEDHLWTHSPAPKPHKCRAGFTDGKATCQYVNMGFARVADRNRHELKHYDGRFLCPFGIESCRIGNERFGRLDTFKRHLKTVHSVTEGESYPADGGPGVSSGSTGSTPPVAGPARPKRRQRSRKSSSSDEKLECNNCNKVYYGVDGFIAHLNDCTFALMHPGETETDGLGDVDNDEDE